jgi:hypothetical protein
VLAELFVSGDFGEAIRVSTSPDALRVLSHLIRAGTGELQVESEWGQMRLIVGSSAEPRLLRFCLDRDHLVLSIIGQQRDLDLLALNLEGLADAVAPYHWHLEWFDDHYFLDGTSTPCVFELAATP